MRRIGRHGTTWAMALALALPVVGTARGDNPEESAGYYEDGAARFTVGDYAGALLQLKKALSLTPTNLAARVLAGRTYLRLGNGPAAADALRRARSSGADADLILIPLGTAYLMQGEFKRVLQELTPESVSESRREQVHLFRGRAYLGLEDLDQANSEFASAATLNPRGAGALLGQAQVYLRRGRVEEARGLLDRAAQLAATDPNVWLRKAEFHRMLGENGPALNFYGRALELAPNLVAARVGRAATLIDGGRDAAALKDVEQVRAVLPRDPQANYLYALIKAHRGDKQASDAALSEIGKTLGALDPAFLDKHAPSLFLSGVVAFRQGRLEKAGPLLQRFLRLRPYHTGARKLLGQIYLVHGDVRAALETLEPAFALTPQDPELLMTLGQAYRLARKYNRSEELLSKALALAPRRHDIAQQIALTRRAAGRKGEAQATLEASLARAPGDFRTGLLLGDLYLDQGKYDQAIAAASRLFKLRRRDPAVFVLAGRAQMLKGHVLPARTAFEKALAIQPQYLPAQFGLAELAYRRGIPEEASKRYARIIEHSPNNLRALSGMARVALFANHKDKAVDWLERLRAHHPDAVEELLMLADLYLQDEHNQKAEQVLADLETRNPDDLAVVLTRARLELAAERVSNARSTLRRGARLAGFSALWLHRVARLQIRAEDFSAAEWSLQKAVAAQPDYIPAAAALVRVELRLGRAEKALSYAERVRAQYPLSVLGDTLVGTVLEGMKRYGAAAAAYRDAMAKNPSSELMLRVFRVRRTAGEKKAALSELRAWAKSHPKDRAIRRALAEAYLEAGKFGEAQAGYEELLMAMPSDVPLLNNLAWLYMQAGDPRALVLAERAYLLAPRDPPTLDTLGWLLIRRGDNGRGLELLRQAHVRAAQQPVVRYHLGVALSNLGRIMEAREHLRAAIGSPKPFAERAQAQSLLARLGAQ